MSRFSPQDYDAWYETPLGSLCDRLEKEAVLTFLKPEGLVLDMGCGTGNYTLELAKHGVKVVGMDSSFDMAAFAKIKTERDGLRAGFVIGKGEAMPFKSNTFNGVLGVTALCFVSNPEKATAEIKRVLKSGGNVVLGELNGLSCWAVLRRIKALFKESIYRKAKFFSLKRLKELLEKAEFKDLKWSSCLYFPPVNSGWFLRLWRLFEILGNTTIPKAGAFLVIAGRKQL